MLNKPTINTVDNVLTTAARSGNRLVKNMPLAEYHAAGEYISRSGLMEFAKSPQHYEYAYLSGQCDDVAQSDALAFGNAFHALLLEPDTFSRQAVVWSGKPRNTKEGKEEYAQAVADAAGRQIIAKSDFDDMQKMADSILRQPVAKQVLRPGGIVEGSFFFNDPSWQVGVKARPDYSLLDDGIVLDLKTCRSAAMADFQRSVANYGYDIQAYMQMLAIEECGYKKPELFIFLCVEKEPPFATAFYSATPDLLMCGKVRYEKLIAKYADCKKRDIWPGYGHLIQPLEPPAYLVKSTEGQENV